jgi:hypothetical protein
MTRKPSPGKVSVRFLLILTLAAMVPALRAQTADDLVAKYIQARGGSEKIRSVNSIRMSGTMTVGAMDVPVTMLMKRPQSVRIEFTVQGSTGIRAFDGSTGWSQMPFLGTPDPALITGAELKDLQNQADIDGALVDYKSKGNKLELAGKDKVNGADAYKLKLTRSNGDVEWIYLDATTYLDVKEEGTHTLQGAERDMETFIGDYRDVNGLKFPFAVQSGVKGVPEQQQKLTIEKVELNVPAEASLFRLPGAAPAGK